MAGNQRGVVHTGGEKRAYRFDLSGSPAPGAKRLCPGTLRSLTGAGEPGTTRFFSSGADGSAMRSGYGGSSHRGVSSNSSSPIDSLPDDIIISIFTALCSKANSASDLINAMLTCRRFCAAGMHSQVLAAASADVMAVRAHKWSDGAHAFLQRAADAGNAEACYTLGVIRFYCLDNRRSGGYLLAKAAIQNHAAALHSLAIIHFNGSAGGRKDKNLKAGVALVRKAASAGHVDAIRELGHCLQDGYGVARDVAEGRRLLLEANAREMTATKSAVLGSLLLGSNWLTTPGSTPFPHWARGAVYGGAWAGAGGAVGEPSSLTVEVDASAGAASTSCQEREGEGEGEESLDSLAASLQVRMPDSDFAVGADNTVEAMVQHQQQQQQQEEMGEGREEEGHDHEEHNEVEEMSRHMEGSQPQHESSSGLGGGAEAAAAESGNHHTGHYDTDDQVSASSASNGMNNQPFARINPVYKLLQTAEAGMSLSFSGFGSHCPPVLPYTVNRFLVDWFSIHQPAPGLRLCSQSNCGRPEMRRHEFRRCSACGCVNYCSRACQALDWKARHKYMCMPVADWAEQEAEEEMVDEDAQVNE